MTKKKEFSKLIKLTELMNNYKIKPTKKTYEILEKLWDADDNYISDKETDVISEVQLYQKRAKRDIEEIIKKVNQEMTSFGLKEEEDYVIGLTSKGIRKGLEHSIYITFRLKGNREIINHFECKGWIIDRRYRNEDGDPSIWASDIHGKNHYHKVTMIVMKYIIDDINLIDKAKLLKKGY